MEIQQGDVLKVEKIKDPVFVASKNFFNQSGEIIGREYRKPTSHLC